MKVKLWRRERKLKAARFQKKWQELQKMCSSKENWAEAVWGADKLLDEALRKKHIRGKNMGERLVQAQRLLSDNDGVWFGHKLRAKIEADPEVKLKEPEVKNALVGIRQALKDLGALPSKKDTAKEPNDK
ncbi:MAG TPA: hypothetical protein VJR27_02030 [Candidatus Saccharimonadales bacterium]|nr:hypothetical protein [Candidatus Saccharimonadales bacterium]